MPNPPGRGHFFGGPQKSGHFDQPKIGSKSMPYKGADVTVQGKPETITPVKTGSGKELDISPKGTETHPVDFYQNQGDAGARGEEIPMRTDLPNSDSWRDASGNLKPEIQDEVNKTQQLTDEPAKLRAQGHQEAVDYKDPQGGNQSPGDGEDSAPFFGSDHDNERSMK